MIVTAPTADRVTVTRLDERTMRRRVWNDEARDARLAWRHPIHTGNTDAVIDAIRKGVEKVAGRVPGITVELLVADADTNGTDQRDLFCFQHRYWGCDEGPRNPYASPCRPVPADRTEVAVLVTGAAIDGWDIVGTLTQDAGGAVVAVSFGAHGDLATSHRHLVGRCDHCHTLVRRSIVVLVRNRADGAVKAIGRSCLAEWTGNAVKGDVLALLTGLGERFQTAYGRTADAEVVAPTEVVVALAAKIAAAHGYVRSNAGSATEPSTADRVRRALLSEHAPGSITADTLTAADLANARRIIAALLADTSATEFAVNLRSAVEAPQTQITGKRNRVGFLAYASVAAEQAIAHAERRAAREAERAAREATQVNAWIGEFRTRRAFAGTIVLLRGVENDFGFSTLMLVETPEGMVKVFGKVSGVDITADQGKAVTFTATIVDHEMYEGRRQTRVNRLAGLEVVAAG